MSKRSETKLGTSVMETMSEYTKALYESSKMAADASTKAIKADKTILATIIDNSDWENGCYECQYESGTFKAYAIRDDHYEVDTIVYVQVPQSDFDKQKFIIGKQVDIDANDVYNYEFAFDSFVKLKKFCDLQGSVNFRANQPKNEIDLNEDTPWDNLVSYGAINNTADIGNHGEAVVGDRLGISMKVQSLLSSWNPQSGNYGIEVVLEGYTSDSSGTESSFKRKSFLFDKHLMYGNIYAYTTPIEQQVVFDISEYRSISNIIVNFWQDCEFTDEYEQYINWKNPGGSKVLPNIILSDILVYTGYPKDRLGGNKLYLYSYDSLIYGEEPSSSIPRADLDTRSMIISLIYYDSLRQTYQLAQTLEQLEDMGAKIYWYIRDESWIIDSLSNPIYNGDASLIKEEHSYGGMYWAPISKFGKFPTEIADPNELIYDDCSAQFVCDLNKSRYQFKVVAIVNNEVISSDILTFTNRIDTEGLKDQLSLNDKIVIRPAMFLSTEDGTEMVLYPDEQFLNFFVYDENNRIIHTDDKRRIEYNGETLCGIDNVKYSDITYFLELWVRADVFGLAQETADDKGYVRVSNWKTHGTNKYLPFKITWDIPLSSYSMMDIHELNDSYTRSYSYYNIRNNYLVEWEGEYPEEWEEKENITLFDIDKMATRVFTVRDQYDMLRQHNTVSCTFERNGQTYTAKRTFLFGRAAAQGCDYTPIISIDSPAGNSYLVTNSSFDISCYVIDRYGNLVDDQYTVQWSAIGNAPNWEVSLDSHHIHGNIGDSVEPFVLTAEVHGLVDWTLHARRGMMITNSPTFLTNHLILCPNRVEFDSAGQVPHYAKEDFECRTLNAYNEIDEYFYPVWHLTAPTNDFKNLVHLIPEPIYKIKYYLVQSSATYNPDYHYVYVDLDLCYHALDPKDPDLLETFNKYKTQNILFRAVSETYAEYYDQAGLHVSEEAPIVYAYHLTYEPGGAEVLQGTKDTVWQWRDEYATDPAYFTYLSFYWIEEFLDENGILQSRNIEVTLAIAYDRSLYPSSLINEWDGKSLSLDEEHSAIMSTMIAAGTKNIKNLFTGVMMGNWIGHGDSSFNSDNRSNASGLYGMLNGEFTFAFLDDGTGYIGPAGKGRIQFDGRNALISNSTYTCYLNLNPNTIVESGTDSNGINWYADTGRGISQYFLYCLVPVDPRAITFDRVERKLTWADKFLEDDDNNYFVVDPSHGAMLSGGIVSKYGRIGNWYINSTGLYQEYKAQDGYINGEYVGSSNSRFMYLGMPGVSESALQNVWNTYERLLEDNEEARLQRIENTGETDLSITETLMRDLNPYLRKDLMTIDVYHYYTSSLALLMFIDYVEPFLDKYDNGEYISTSALVNDIYNVDNLIDPVFGLYRYDNINLYLHNHYLKTATTSGGITYPAGTRTTGIAGLFPNLTYVMGFTRYNISNFQYIYYVNLDDIYYSYYRRLDNQSSTYFTVNQIGDIRVYSYDPTDFSNKIKNTILNILTNNHGSGLGTAENSLKHDRVNQNEMNGYWWQPILHPDDIDGTIYNQFWDGSWKTVTNPDQIYLAYNGIDIDGLRNWIATTKIYLYYAQQQYNQVLFRLLQVGYNDLYNSRNNSAEDLQKYTEAAAIIDTYGGLEGIKAIGVASTNSNYTEESDLTDEQKVLIELLKLKAINQEFDDNAAAIKRDRAQAIRKLNEQEDTEKYAIYAGHNSPLDLTAQLLSYLNPWFGVKWNGYMIARSGQIGNDSPWYISDAGLTQKNNSDIIFLGDPELDGSPSIYRDNSLTDPVTKGQRAIFTKPDGTELTVNNHLLLPNGYKTTDGKIVYIEGQTAPENGQQVPKQFVTWTGTPIQDLNKDYPYPSSSVLRYLGPEAFGEYGKFAIYAGTDIDGINFGVRMDGTVYCKRLQTYKAKIVGGTISGALLSDNDIKFGWDTLDDYNGTVAHEASYSVNSKVLITNFTTSTFDPYVLAGGTIHVYRGGLYEVRNASTGLLTSLTILDNNGETLDYNGTRVTIVDSFGTKYYYYNTTTNLWVSHAAGFFGVNFREKLTTAQMAQYVAGQDAILLGGGLTGWVIDGSKIYIRRELSLGYAQPRWVESILLDGDTNSIQVANGQIYLDGTNGILFLGRPTMNNSIASNFATDSHIVMSNINITAHTVGITTYTSSVVAGSSIVTLKTAEETSTGGNSNYTFNEGPIVDGYTVKSGEDKTYTIHGTTELQAMSTAGSTYAGELITRAYDGGFYTICYNLSDPLGAPFSASNTSPVVNGYGGLGVAFLSNNNSLIALYPFADDSQLGFTVGNNHYRWNIQATCITASEGIWLIDSSDNLDPVICKSAFDAAISSINALLNSLAATCGGLATDTANVGNVANAAMAKATTALSTAYTALAGCIKDIKVETVAAVGGFEGFKITATTNSNASIVSNGYAFAKFHGHEMLLERTGSGSIKLTCNDVADKGLTATVSIFVGKKITISKESGSGSADICGKDLEIDWDLSELTSYAKKEDTYTKAQVDELVEKTFKNGWNAAVDAISADIPSGYLVGNEGNTGSRSNTISFTVSGGNGKKSYSKVITVTLTNLHTEATVDKGGLVYKEGEAIRYDEHGNNGVRCYTDFTDGTYAYIKTASKSSCSVSYSSS